MKIVMKKLMKLNTVILTVIFLGMGACESLDTVNLNNPDRQRVLASGTDLLAVMSGGYVAFWQGIHQSHPVMALNITSDAFGVSWGNFGGRRMGEEPRQAYNNRASESADYKQLTEDPWFGALSAVSTANDILLALQAGTSIDNGGDQDKMVEASALFLRGVSTGYLGLIFDQAFRVVETDDVSQQLDFVPYTGMIQPAVDDLMQAASIAGSAGAGFSHQFFNGITMDPTQFIQLCHSYSARFLASWPRTEAEAAGIDWAAVKSHAEQGIDWNFAPIADGNFWFGYYRYAYADTGNGPFWARLDQRLVAAFDPSQPTRYPEVIAKGEPPLANPMATSADSRLDADYVFVADQNFATDRGEWHFSHYKHNRNLSDPTFAGDGNSAGPMPAFRADDNQLLLAEANLNLGDLPGAAAIIDAGPRVTRGNLPPLGAGASFDEIERAIRYERSIELNNTAPFSQWLDRRRWGPRQQFDMVDDLGGLQLGTPAQLPVPADELGVREEAPYNFGGAQDPEGINRF